MLGVRTKLHQALGVYRRILINRMLHEAAAGDLALCNKIDARERKVRGVMARIKPRGERC